VLANRSDGSNASHLPWNKPVVFADLERSDEGAFVRELIDVFLTDSAARIAGLKKAASAMDMAALSAAAHALKGSALSMNAVPIAELSLEIEQSARLNAVRDYSLLVDGLDSALAEIGRELTEYVEKFPLPQSA
jgi:HPt (histidine-containing phosphotransfer) domain-containing protein